MSQISLIYYAVKQLIKVKEKATNLPSQRINGKVQGENYSGMNFKRDLWPPKGTIVF